MYTTSIYLLNLFTYSVYLSTVCVIYSEIYLRFTAYLWVSTVLIYSTQLNLSIWYIYVCTVNYIIAFFCSLNTAHIYWVYCIYKMNICLQCHYIYSIYSLNLSTVSTVYIYKQCFLFHCLFLVYVFLHFLQYCLRYCLQYQSTVEYSIVQFSIVYSTNLQ